MVPVHFRATVSTFPLLHCVSCSRLEKNLLTEETGLVPSNILQTASEGHSLSNIATSD